MLPTFDFNSLSCTSLVGFDINVNSFLIGNILTIKVESWMHVTTPQNASKQAHCTCST